ncbi:YihY/virulence factor BrkB family protein [Fructobacillus sp. W13]|uniref:YihY/virulence factor BrkB family protein n=1 Tax=Fructobacillus apis TaxID=2935017 RepID=A0ABT0ZP88_9LACO|nr:YhjD/YihY/BrkB family envelope integrity protein [Fructobacillus apis]MCO0831799.1 YihY/virulence factor BrkB family protein [Fructobacillus apis]
MINRITKGWAKLDRLLHVNDLVLYFSRAQIGLVGPTFAYYVLLTLFPLLIAVVLVISALNVTTSRLSEMMADFLPATVNEFIHPILNSVAHTNTQSYWSLSLIFIIWALSRVITVLREAFNRVADAEEPFLPILARLWSFLWLILMVVVFTVLIFAGNILGVYIQDLTGLGFWVKPTRWVLMFGLWAVLIWMNYELPTKEARAPFLASLLGSLFDLVALNGLNKVFALVAKFQFGKYGFYQSLTSIIVFLLWLNLVATVLVTGFVLMNWLSGFNWIGRKKNVSKD